jgi:hypothetical protein
MRKLKHRSISFALDEALSEREYQMLKAAYAAAYGQRLDYIEPKNPNIVEQHYLNAIEAFWNRKPTRGYDEIERGNHKALLRLGRSKRRKTW